MTFGTDLLEYSFTVGATFKDININYTDSDGITHTENYWKKLSQEIPDTQAFILKCRKALHSISTQTLAVAISNIDALLAHCEKQRDTLLKKNPETPKGHISKEGQLKKYDNKIRALKNKKNSLIILQDLIRHKRGSNNQDSFITDILKFVERS
jgi:superfamily II RNA helicase